MPVSRTPLRATPRQNARPQFASTPRFLFSQRTVTQSQQTHSDSITAEDEPYSQSRPAPTPARGPPSRRKEVIEDSGSDLELDQQLDDGAGREGVSSDSPPDMTEMDAEMDALFGPTRHRDKRRRVSVDISSSLATPEARKGRRPHDIIDTSSPEPSPFPSTAAPGTEAEPISPSLPYRSTPQSQKTPRPPATPATSTSKPTVRNLPRFLVSSASQPPQKPTFVLPRSPSPDQDQGDGNANTIPTPFSPSSHALRRRGRQRSSAPSYLPGGMAAEVRSWVLEMGTKREQQMQMQAAHSAGQNDEMGPSKYSLILRISNVRQSALGSCGPLAFVQGQPTTSGTSNEILDSQESADDSSTNVLLMGAPRLRPGELRPSSRVPGLRAGDVVGVLRGLVWEIGLDAANTEALSEDEQALLNECESFPGGTLGTWLVCMEWEVLSSV